MGKYQVRGKRWFDLIFGLIFFFLSIIIIIPLAIVIKLHDRGPIITQHIRVGKEGKLFVMYKLRTRKIGALTPINLGRVSVDWVDSVPESFLYDKDSATLDNVTRFGKILRKTRLDELPQLWNVVIGNMSLVGPRPEIREIAEFYDDKQGKRLQIRPGLTGLAQVQGELPSGEKIDYDLDYLERSNLWLDIKILLTTILLPRKKMASLSEQKEGSFI